MCKDGKGEFWVSQPGPADADNSQTQVGAQQRESLWQVVETNSQENTDAKKEVSSTTELTEFVLCIGSQDQEV